MLRRRGEINKINLTTFDFQILRSDSFHLFTNRPLFAKFTARLTFAAIADSSKLEFNEPCFMASIKRKLPN